MNWKPILYGFIVGSIIILLTLGFYADAHAITFDSTASDSDNSPDNHHEWEHTTGVGASLLIVAIGNATVQQVSYAGQSMTLAISTSSDRWTMWYLLNPTAGTNLVIATTSASDNMAGGSISLFGTRTATPIIGATKNEATPASSPITKTLDTNYENSWIVDNCFVNGGNSSNWNVSGTNQTERYTDDNFADLQAHGSTQSTTAPSTYTQTWTYSLSATANICQALEIIDEDADIIGYNITWKYPTNGTAINVRDTLSTKMIVEYKVPQTGYLRFRISTTTDFSNYIYDSGGIPAYATNASTTYITYYPLSIWNNVYPTTTQVYFKAWFYTLDQPLITIRTSSTITAYLDTTTTPPWYEEGSISTSTLFYSTKFSDVARHKFPFSYVFEVADLFAGNYSASTTPSFSFTIGNETYGTSTVILFSTSTLQTALGNWLQTARGIMVAILWIWFAGFIWSEGMSYFKSSIQ